MGLLLIVPILVALVSLGHSQFTENWSSPSSSIFVTYATHGSAQSGFVDDQALDSRSLRLTLNSSPPPGVGGAPAAETLQRYQFGTYWTRAKTGNCSAQPKAGVVSGIFTYFNDGRDRNGNGLPDNSEIDFEWLCAAPEIVHLSIWTDYEEADPPRLRALYRTINLRTGRVLMDCYREAFGQCQLLSGPERQPSSVNPLPGYDSSTKYYSYGLEFAEDRVHFMIQEEDGGEIITLWDYRGPSQRIPKDSMHFMHNVWHTNNWWPEDDVTAIETPRSPVYMFVDRSTFVPPP